MVTARTNNDTFADYIFLLQILKLYACSYGKGSNSKVPKSTILSLLLNDCCSVQEYVTTIEMLLILYLLPVVIWLKNWRYIKRYPVNQLFTASHMRKMAWGWADGSVYYLDNPFSDLPTDIKFQKAVNWPMVWSWVQTSWWGQYHYIVNMYIIYIFKFLLTYEWRLI